VITSGGFTAAFDILGPIFGQASGIEVVTEYGSSMGGGPESIPVRLARGETADILILNRPPLDELTDAGHIRPESRVDLVRSVLAAIGYSASVSGTYLDSLNGRDLYS
jgi:molybdate transport system substrate-binding protein